jgi:hypothetical protein
VGAWRFLRFVHVGTAPLPGPLLLLLLPLLILLPRLLLLLVLLLQRSEVAQPRR